MKKELDEDLAIAVHEPDPLQKTDRFSRLLEKVRPEWQSRSLIERVKRLLPVDPSSACQRLLNAAIHDLRTKVIVAGLDIAREAAKKFKLPPVDSEESIEQYSTAKLIDLSYRMGLLSRPEWRRLQRAYEIRRDLEHEDDEYEAQPEDCIYVFRTTIGAVLAKDPIQLIRVTDVKQFVETSDPCTPSSELLDEYQCLPQPRQEEICGYLVNTALNDKQADVVRANSVEMLRHLEPLTQIPTKLAVAKQIQERMGRGAIEVTLAKVAQAIGAMPYLKKARIRDFFDSYLKKMRQVGHDWRQHREHGKLLGDLEDFGGLTHCPDSILPGMVEWLVLAYIGEPGGYGAGINRPVFYSNSAAPIIKRLMQKPTNAVRETLSKVAEGKAVRNALHTKWINRRLEELLDLLE